MHKMYGAKGMMKPGMNGTGINQFSEAQLPDPSHALNERMFH